MFYENKWAAAFTGIVIILTLLFTNLFRELASAGPAIRTVVSDIVK